MVNLKEALIVGGYILLSRKIIESEIFKKPPLYLKVWIYLLSAAQHSQYKNLNRGQLFTSIPEIQEACSHYIGFRKQIPSKDKIFNILQWLRRVCEHSCEHDDEHDTNTTMITTVRATQGILVNVERYSFYQDPQNYTTSRGGMQSSLKEAGFRYYNGEFRAEFLRDGTTSSSTFYAPDLINGRPLSGKTILIKLVNNNTSAVYLRGVRINAQSVR